MTRSAAADRTSSDQQTAGTLIWITLIAALTVIGSYGWACAAPLAAVAALAALSMGRTEGLALVLVTWLVNQFVGFVLLSYPHTFDSYAWGAAIGIAGVVGLFAARAVVRPGMSALSGMTAAFAAAFVAFQIALYVVGNGLSYDPNAFTVAIVTEVLVINAVAYVGFLLIHRAAVALSLRKPVAGRAAPATV